MSSVEYSDDDSYGDDDFYDSYGAIYSQSNNSRECSDDESYGEDGSTYLKSNNSQEYSGDESYDDRGTNYSNSDNNQEYSDDESYDDRGTNYSKSNNSQEYSGDESYDEGDESYDDRGTTYSKYNSPEYSDDEYYDDSGESKANGGEDSDDDSYALGDYNTTHSAVSKATSSGNRVSVHQQTYRLKNEDKQSGSYERFTAKDKTVSGEPFVDRYGNRGYKDERITTSTYKTGDRRGYTEYSLEEKVKHVDYNKSSNSNNKSVKSYSKNSKR